MRGPGLTLVTYFAPKIKLTTFINQLTEGFSVRFGGYFATHVAETVHSIQTLFWHNEICLRIVIGCNALQRSNTVLSEQNLAHSWQNSAPQTGTRCMSQHGSQPSLPVSLYPWSSELFYKWLSSTQFNFLPPKLPCHSYKWREAFLKLYVIYYIEHHTFYTKLRLRERFWLL